MNILIVKTGALGDVVRTSFIAQALKDKYRSSGARVYWLTQKKAKAFFLNNPYVDFVLDENDVDNLREKDFDLVVNLEEGEEITKFISTLNKKKLIGVFWSDGCLSYTDEGKDWFDMSMISKFGKKKADILKKKNKKSHRQLIGEMVGVRWEKFEPFIRLTDAQRKIASEFLRRYNLNRRDLIIGINTGGADRWPKSLSVQKTAKLIDMIGEKFDSKILLFGGPNEIERNREIVKLSKSGVIDTGSGNNLLEFPALVSVCSMFVTSDSLGQHIALALKRRTISLIGPTSPSEIEMFGFGEKIVAKSRDVCSYKSKSNCMDKIDLNSVIKAMKSQLDQKITLIITAFKEPGIGKAISAALRQKTGYDYNVIVSAPDKETLDIARKFAQSDKRVGVFVDPGKGKSFALNMLIKKIKTDILILTDGDVFIGENSVEEIANLFLDPEIGCVTGRPMPIEGKESKYGYWANFLFDAAHSIRRDAFLRNGFIECSGYLFAFRKNKVDSIPLDVAEDTVIPYFFWEKGYKIGYAEGAEVFVKNVNNWEDWIKQKTRTSKAHETLDKYVDTETTRRIKTFGNEAKGIKMLLSYPSNTKEIIWTFNLLFARLLMWGIVYRDTKFNNKHYQDAWERSESTKI